MVGAEELSKPHGRAIADRSGAHQHSHSDENLHVVFECIFKGEHQLRIETFSP